MQESSIDRPPSAQEIYARILNAGFCEAKILYPFKADRYVSVDTDQNRSMDAPSILVCTLAYGNSRNPASDEGENRLESFSNTENRTATGKIAPFARRNYYNEAVSRLKKLSKELRSEFGGKKAEFRIYCNSCINEKLLAKDSGIACMGRNGLLITESAGSLVIIAAMTLPYTYPEGKHVIYHKENAVLQDADFSVCTCCKEAACVKACPGAALDGEGNLQRTRCIQWYASGNEEQIPDDIQKIWGKRLYGCTNCQDVCPHNKKKIASAVCDKGSLPAEIELEMLIAMSDEEIKTMFKGSAMGMSWLGPAAIRRNALMALQYIKKPRNR